ncbi:hypothetical protein PESP_b0443 [Pseudoalteromonas espejiana DSM 9414]|nr:hypothetical protein PESP_b0443 [Pseudoalteromonas espejiana DSM 9414]
MANWEVSTRTPLTALIKNEQGEVIAGQQLVHMEIGYY